VRPTDIERGSDVPIDEAGLYRIAVHVDSAHADLTLPSEVPVATLIPAVLDLMPCRSGPEPLRPYRLAEPGRAALDGGKTLSQQGIRDGCTLLLTRAETQVPQVVFDDPAEEVAAAVRTIARPWGPAERRLTAALSASGLAGAAGFVAIPGGPGAPNVLMAVAAAGAVALMAVPPCGCTRVVRMILCCLAGLALLSAVAGMAVAATGIAPARAGAAGVVAGVGMIRAADRVAAVVTGLSHRAASQAARAHELLTGVVAAATALVFLGAATVVAAAPSTGAPQLVGAVFACTAGAAVALRARSHADGVQMASLIAGGTATLAIGLLGAAHHPTGQWPAALAGALGAAALGLGFADPIEPPLIRRGAEVLEALTLGALVPLACWLCGVYGAARGLSLG
jgi:hypothetical protein